MSSLAPWCSCRPAAPAPRTCCWDDPGGGACRTVTAVLVTIRTPQPARPKRKASITLAPRRLSKRMLRRRARVAKRLEKGCRALWRTGLPSTSAGDVAVAAFRRRRARSRSCQPASLHEPACTAWRAPARLPQPWAMYCDVTTSLPPHDPSVPSCSALSGFTRFSSHRLRPNRKIDPQRGGEERETRATLGSRSTP